MEYYESGGLASAALEIGHTTAAGSTLTHELGHSFGFKHYPDNDPEQDCEWPGSIMGDAHCTDEGHPIDSAPVDRANWDLAYWADAVIDMQTASGTGYGSVQYNWLPGSVHNEARFDIWSYDGNWNYLGSAAKSTSPSPIFYGQMPTGAGFRSYYVFSVTNGHVSYFGGSQSIGTFVQGALPAVTSVVPYGPQTMVVSWANSNPAGADVHVEVATAGPNGPWVEVGQDTASPFQHNGLTAGTRYWYRVRSHSHSAGGYSGYSAVTNNYTPPNVPASLGGSFNVSNNPNTVSSCFSPVSGSSTYSMFFYKAGVGSGSSYTLNPNSSCYGSVIYTRTLTAEVYHIAVKACNAGGCSSYRDMAGSYWWWIPCSTGTGCSAGGAPDAGGHAH